MILSIASQKGGTGKTTTAISLAAGLGRSGKRVLLIDVDSQANSSKVLLPGYEKLDESETVWRTIMLRQPLLVRQTEIPNLDIVPSHILLSGADMELTTAKDHREARLRNRVDEIVGKYEHVLIDCPPALSWLTLNAFTASDQVMIVVSPGYFELDSIAQMSKTIEEVREFYNSNFRLLGILFAMSDPTVNSKTSLQVLRQTFTDSVFKTVIPRNTDIRDAHFSRQDIFAYAPDAKAAQAYKKLLKELGL